MQKFILLIDDDKNGHAFFSEAILDLQCRDKCIYAKDAVSALDLLTGSRPNYIFIALKMPDLAGLTCLEGIRKLPHLKEVPIFLYYRDINIELIEKDLLLGTYCFKKPFLIKDLTALLNYFICKSDFEIASGLITEMNVSCLLERERWQEYVPSNSPV